MSVNRILDEEIVSELENLARVQIGSEEYIANVDGVVKLLDRKINLEKTEAERTDRIECRDAEMDLKLKQMKEDKNDRYLKHGITIVTTGGLAWLYWKAFKASMKFEETGTIASDGGKDALKKVFNLFKLI